MTETYTASRCPCGHRGCSDWHVNWVAAVQGVHFTEGQARAVAGLLTAIEKYPDAPTISVALPWHAGMKLVGTADHPSVVLDGWRPIDTAPRSGGERPRHYVLARGPSGMVGVEHFVTLAYHDAEYRPLDPWRAVDNSALSDQGWVPTEWMECP